MTKAELITALEGKFTKVFSPSLTQTYDNFNYYLVKVYDVIDDSIRDFNVAFYVKDEGQGTERAFWSPSEPKQSPSISTSTKLQNYIDARIADDTIEIGKIEVLNNANEAAIVTVVLDQSGILVEKKLLVDTDAQGDLRYRVIG